MLSSFTRYRKRSLETPFRDHSGLIFREMSTPPQIQNPRLLVRASRNTADPRNEEAPRSSLIQMIPMGLASPVAVPPRTNLMERNPSQTRGGLIRGKWKLAHRTETGSRNSYPTEITGEYALSAWALAPQLGLGATILARIGLIAGTSGTLIPIVSSDLLNTSQLSRRAEKPPTAAQVKGSNEAQSRAPENQGSGQGRVYSCHPANLWKIGCECPGHTVLRVSQEDHSRCFQIRGFGDCPLHFACFQAAKSR